MADAEDISDEKERTRRSDERLSDYRQRQERLRAAVASGPVVRIPLTGAADPPDPRNLAPADPDQLAEILGRHPTTVELAVAPAMLADARAWAADPARQRQFLETELDAWTAAYADRDCTANPYLDEDADKDLRTVWVGAHFRALSSRARARHAASQSHCPGPSGSGAPAAVAPWAQ